MTEGKKVVLTSKTGLISEAEYHVFFFSAKTLKKELEKFLELETGMELTIEFSVDEETNALCVNIREKDDLVPGVEEEMTVGEFLDVQYDYPFSSYGGEEAVAREMVCRLFGLDSNHLAHLQYFEDDEEDAKVRMSISANHFSSGLADNDEETIAGTYLGRRAVSNMLYFLIKAAQEEIDLSLTYPRCSHFADVVNGTILEWADDIERMMGTGDPAFPAMEQFLLVELREGTYLNEGREKFMSKLERALAPGEDDPKRLFIFQLIDRISKEAEAIRQTWNY